VIGGTVPLILNLGGREESDLKLNRLTPEEETSRVRCMDGWAGFRSSLDPVAPVTLPVSARNQTLGGQAVGSLYRLSYPDPKVRVFICAFPDFDDMERQVIGSYVDRSLDSTQGKPSVLLSLKSQSLSK
jgi:hypothetical protein